MKKILFLSLALLVTGTMYADKKCCKDKSTCSHSEAKACNHGEAKAEVNDDGTPKEAHAGCAHAKASGAKACCAKGGHHEAGEKAAPAQQDAKPMRDDNKR